MNTALCFVLVSLAHRLSLWHAQQPVPCHRLPRALTSVAPLTPTALFPPCRRHSPAQQDVVHSCALWVWHHHTWDVWHKVPSRLMSGPRWLPSCVGLLCARRAGFSAHGFLTTACSMAKVLQWKEFPSSDGLFSPEKNTHFLISLSVSFLPTPTGELHSLHLHHPYLSPEVAFPRHWTQWNQPVFVSPRLFQLYRMGFGKPVWLLVRYCMCLHWSESSIC